MHQMFMTYVIFAETFENNPFCFECKLFIYKVRELADFFSVNNQLFCYTNPVALVFGLLFVVCV